MDYVGIVALIFGSFVPSVYYGFYCEPMLQKTYWGMVSFRGDYSSYEPYTEPERPDINHCHSLHYCLYQSKVPNPSMETLSSKHVCVLWPFSRFSSPTWGANVWCRPDAVLYGPLLGNSARFPLHHRRCTLRGASLVSAGS